MLKLGGLHLEATSIGGLETCIEVPDWGLCFDIGRCPPTAVRRQRVLMTHAHMDHLGGIAMHCATRELMALPTPIYHVPRENVADIEALFEVWRRLDRSDLRCEIHPCGPGDRFPIGNGRVAVPFRSPHRVPCQGYAIEARRKKLLPQYVGADGEEIRRLRQEGVVVSEEVEVVELAFTGDTVIDVLEREEAVRRARLLVMEVTFLDDRVPVPRARSSGHVHLDEVVERAALFENEAILFTHFSARYSPGEVRRIVSGRLPPGLAERVHLLLPE